MVSDEELYLLLESPSILLSGKGDFKNNYVVYNFIFTKLYPYVNPIQLFSMHLFHSFISHIDVSSILTEYQNETLYQYLTT